MLQNPTRDFFSTFSRRRIHNGSINFQQKDNVKRMLFCKSGLRNNVLIQIKKMMMLCLAKLKVLWQQKNQKKKQLELPNKVVVHRNHPKRRQLHKTTEHYLVMSRFNFSKPNLPQTQLMFHLIFMMKMFCMRTLKNSWLSTLISKNKTEKRLMILVTLMSKQINKKPEKKKYETVSVVKYQFKRPLRKNSIKK